MKNTTLGRGELAPTEPHPAAYAAREWIAKQPPENLFRWLESFSSCAIEGNRLAEVCAETLNRLMHSQPVSDRYVLGLAWTLRAENWPTAPATQKNIEQHVCEVCGHDMMLTTSKDYVCPCEPPNCEPQKETVATWAEKVARIAHENQFRRDGVTPYVAHLEAVVAKLDDESDEVRAVAWLHDTLEDTKFTDFGLRENGIPEEVVAVVRILTHKRGVSYEDYLLKVKENPVALKVKIADMLHNIGDSPTKAQTLKYVKGLQILHS